MGTPEEHERERIAQRLDKLEANVAALAGLPESITKMFDERLPKPPAPPAPDEHVVEP